MVTTKDESFFKYSALSMQAEVLKVKYWIDGYAICNLDDKYYWLLMPLATSFYYNDNTMKTVDMQPVCDVGTLETISFFIEISPQVNALNLQPVSCTFKAGVIVEITHIILLHLKNHEYYSVPVSKLHLLTYDLPLSTGNSTIASPIKLFYEAKCNET